MIETLDARCFGGSRGHEIIFQKGKGRYTITNQRIVYVREPLTILQVMWQFSPLATAGKGGAIDVASRARYVRKYGGKEFFEIPFDEIKRVAEALLFGAGIEVKGHENYEVDVPKLIGRALKKALITQEYKINKKGFVEPPSGYVPKKKEGSQDVQRRKRKSFKERLSEMTLKDILLWVLQILIVIFMIGFFILITK